jgi:hypothetical protein
MVAVTVAPPDEEGVNLIPVLTDADVVAAPLAAAARARTRTIAATTVAAPLAAAARERVLWNDAATVAVPLTAAVNLTAFLTVAVTVAAPLADADLARTRFTEHDAAAALIIAGAKARSTRVAVAFEFAGVDPEAFVAVTTQRTFSPTSAVASVYVLLVALEMSTYVPAFPDVSRCHW